MDPAAALLQKRQRPAEIRFLYQNVVGIVGGDGKEADFALRQYSGDLSQYAYQGEIQHALHAKRPPSVLADQRVCRNPAGGTDQGNLFVGSAEKTPGRVWIDAGAVLQLADREVLIDNMLFHMICSLLGKFVFCFAGPADSRKLSVKTIIRAGAAKCKAARKNSDRAAAIP